MDINLRIKLIKELENIKYNILDFIENNGCTLSQSLDIPLDYFKRKKTNIEIFSSISELKNIIIEYDSALPNIMNYAYIPVEKNGNKYLYVIFDEENEDDESLENTLILIENRAINMNNIVSESNATNKMLYPIYIMISFTKTSFGNLIKKVTHSKYTHSAISLDSSMEKMYSFDVINGQSGFSIESIKDYRQDEDCITCINVFFVSAENLMKLQKVLNWFTQHRDSSKYSFLNCVTLLLNIPLQRDNKMICSQFVDFVLKSIDIDITGKKSPLVVPEDYNHIKNPNVYKIYEGPIKDYNPSKINKLINKLKKTVKPIIESMIIASNDVIDNINNIYTEQININMIDLTKYGDELYNNESLERGELIQKETVYDMVDKIDIIDGFELYSNRFTGVKKLTLDELYNIYGTSEFKNLNECIKILYNLPFKNIKVFDRDFTINPEILLFDSVTDCNKIFSLVNKYGETYKFSIYNDRLYLLVGCDNDIFGILILSKHGVIHSQVKYLCNPKKGDILRFIKDFTHFQDTQKEAVIEGKMKDKYIYYQEIDNEITECSNDIMNNFQNKNIDGLKSDMNCILLISNKILDEYKSNPFDYLKELKTKTKRLYQQCNMYINRLTKYNEPFNGIKYLKNNECSETIKLMIGENTIDDNIKWLILQ